MNVVHLNDEQLPLLAALIAKELRHAPAFSLTTDPGERSRRLVDAGTLATELGVTRAWVYANTERLGGVRIGEGSKPRLRFDRDRAREAITTISPERPAEDAPRGARRSPRSGLPKPGSVLAVKAS